LGVSVTALHALVLIQMMPPVFSGANRAFRYQQCKHRGYWSPSCVGATLNGWFRPSPSTPMSLPGSSHWCPV